MDIFNINLQTMIMRLKIMMAVCLMILFTACRKHSTETAASEPFVKSEMPSGIEVADTIIYQVIISNPNPDDTWTTSCLNGLNRKILVDSIFGMVYDGRLIAYNRETHEKLTLKQLKDIEKADGFSRDKIGMIQFTEAWYLDPATRAMTKKVLAMDLGYDYYSSEGDLVGYKSLFRVEMNE
jgi:hypothetical protein